MAAFAVAAAAQGIKAIAGLGAAKKRKRAAKLQQQITAISNKQRRRAFLQRFRQAQADALSASVASGAGLESSAVRGTLASQRTQRNVAEGEFVDQARLGAAAASSLSKAADFDLVGGLAGTAGTLALSIPNAPPAPTGGINPPANITGP